MNGAVSSRVLVGDDPGRPHDRRPAVSSCFGGHALGKALVMGSNAADPQPPLSKQLAAGPRTSAEARSFLWEALRDQDVMTNELYDASLLTTEIASNAARHGREPIKVNVSLEQDGFRVSVDDQGSGFDPTDATIRGKGWGVKLVEALSTDWGVEQRDNGTEVWFKI